MFELTISTALADGDYISRCYNKLKCEMKSNSCIIQKMNHYERSCLSFAIKEELKDYYIAKILDEILFIITDKYKFEFFKTRLENECQNVLFQSFLKAICIFDADSDKEIVAKNIDFSGNILIDSLYNFKLFELRKKWQKTIDLILFNDIHKQNASMLDIMKYLTAVSEPNSQNAEIELSNKNIKIKAFEKIKNYKNDFLGLSNFLSEIIELNPAKIIIKHTDESGREAVSMLCKIFYDKIIF